MARQTMGKEGAKFSSPSASPKSGKLMPKKNTAAGDPSLEAKGKKGTVKPDAHGAAHTIKATYQVSTEPAAGKTQANGRVMNPAIKRSTDSFGEGMSTSY
jgi:hypothetical protein